MSPEQKVAVITDSGSSVRPGSEEAKILGITVVPLSLIFNENGKDVAYNDDIPPEDFYQKMKSSERPPKTSGAVTGMMVEAFKNVSNTMDSMISIHITSKHSVAWGSALLARNIVYDEAVVKPNIEVVDSKNVSSATRFLVERAVFLAEKGENLNSISQEITEIVPKIQLFTVLENFENLKRGGRAEEMVKGILASLLSIYPVIGFSDGKLKTFAKERSPNKAREKMVEMVADAGKLEKIAVVHTNALDLAEKIKGSLTNIYKGEIPIYEAGSALAAHAGEGAVGVAFQQA